MCCVFYKQLYVICQTSMDFLTGKNIQRRILDKQESYESLKGNWTAELLCLQEGPKFMNLKLP